jgi:hypothetical protein
VTTDSRTGPGGGPVPDEALGGANVSSSLLAAALAYAARGWPVFPCIPGSKAPLTRHGFHDATTDPEQIRAWWARWPAANVGIATGDPGPDVLDVDVKGGINGYIALNRLKRAGMLTGAGMLVRTPSLGLHVYFGGTTQECGRLPEHGLDFKASGGYVLAPPSVIDGKCYDLLEERDIRAAHNWASDRLLLRPAKRLSARQVTRTHCGMDRLAAWVAELPEGNRNSGLYWAARRAIETGGDPELLIAASTLPELEARRTVGSAVGRSAS